MGVPPPSEARYASLSGLAFGYRDLDFISDDANRKAVDLNLGIVAPRAVACFESPGVPRANHDAVFDMTGCE